MGLFRVHPEVILIKGEIQLYSLKGLNRLQAVRRIREIAVLLWLFVSARELPN